PIAALSWMMTTALTPKWKSIGRERSLPSAYRSRCTASRAPRRSVSPAGPLGSGRSPPSPRISASPNSRGCLHLSRRRSICTRGRERGDLLTVHLTKVVSVAQPVECGPFTPGPISIVLQRRDEPLLRFNQRIETDDRPLHFREKF